MADPEFFSLDPESPDFDPELADMVSIGRALQWIDYLEYYLVDYD